MPATPASSVPARRHGKRAWHERTPMRSRPAALRQSVIDCTSPRRNHDVLDRRLFLADLGGAVSRILAQIIRFCTISPINVTPAQECGWLESSLAFGRRWQLAPRSRCSGYLGAGHLFLPVACCGDQRFRFPHQGDSSRRTRAGQVRPVYGSTGWRCRPPASDRWGNTSPGRCGGS